MLGRGLLQVTCTQRAVCSWFWMYGVIKKSFWSSCNPWAFHEKFVCLAGVCPWARKPCEWHLQISITSFVVIFACVAQLAAALVHIVGNIFCFRNMDICFIALKDLPWEDYVLRFKGLSLGFKRLPRMFSLIMNES